MPPLLSATLQAQPSVQPASFLGRRRNPERDRLSAGGNWIRNFSSALPSVVSRVSEIRDPGRATGRIGVRFDSLQGELGFDFRLTGSVPRLRRLSLLSAEGTREGNGIEEVGTASQSSPWIRNFRSRVGASWFIAPPPLGRLQGFEAPGRGERFSSICRYEPTIAFGSSIAP